MHELGVVEDEEDENGSDCDTLPVPRGWDDSDIHPSSMTHLGRLSIVSTRCDLERTNERLVAQ